MNNVITAKLTQKDLEDIYGKPLSNVEIVLLKFLANLYVTVPWHCFKSVSNRASKKGGTEFKEHMKSMQKGVPTPTAQYSIDCAHDELLYKKKKHEIMKRKLKQGRSMMKDLHDGGYI